MFPRLFILAAFMLSLAVQLLAETKQSKAQLQSIKCQKDVMTQLDDYMSKIELLSDKRKFPETLPQLYEYCRINKRVLKMLTIMAEKCLYGFTKNVLQVTIYSIKRQQKDLCRAKPSKEMKDLLESGKCVNAGNKQFRKCAMESANNVYSIKYVEDKLKVPILCCEIGRAKQCLLKEARKLKQCKDSHIETIQDRFNRVSMNSINIACGDYTEETDRCNNVIPPKGDYLKRSNKTLTMTMFELVDSFPFDEILPA